MSAQRPSGARPFEVKQADGDAVYDQERGAAAFRAKDNAALPSFGNRGFQQKLEEDLDLNGLVNPAVWQRALASKGKNQQSELPELSDFIPRQKTTDFFAKLFASEWMVSGVLDAGRTQDVEAMKLQQTFALVAASDCATRTKPAMVLMQPGWGVSRLSAAHRVYAEDMRHICAVMSRVYRDVPSQWAMLFRYITLIEGNSVLIEKGLRQAPPSDATRRELARWDLLRDRSQDAEVDTKLAFLRDRRQLMRGSGKGRSLADVLETVSKLDAFTGIVKNVDPRGTFLLMKSYVKENAGETGPFYNCAYIPLVRDILRLVRETQLDLQMDEKDRAFLNAATRDIASYVSEGGSITRGFVAASRLRRTKHGDMQLLLSVVLATGVLTARPPVQAVSAEAAKRLAPKAAEARRIVEPGRALCRAYERHAAFLPMQLFTATTSNKNRPALRNFPTAADDAAMRTTVDNGAMALANSVTRHMHPQFLYSLYVRLKGDMMPVLLAHKTVDMMCVMRKRRAKDKRTYCNKNSCREEFLGAELDELPLLPLLEKAEGGVVDISELIIASWIEIVQDMITALQAYFKLETPTQEQFDAMVGKRKSRAALVAHFQCSGLGANPGAAIGLIYRKPGGLLPYVRNTVVVQEDKEKKTEESDRQFMKVADLLDSVEASDELLQASELFTSIQRLIVGAFNYSVKIGVHCAIASAAGSRITNGSDYVSVDAFHAAARAVCEELRETIATIDPVDYSFEWRLRVYIYRALSLRRNTQRVRLMFPLILDTCKMLRAVSPVQLTPKAALAKVEMMLISAHGLYNSIAAERIEKLFSKQAPVQNAVVGLWEDYIGSMWNERAIQAHQAATRLSETADFPDKGVKSDFMLWHLVGSRCLPFANRMAVNEMYSDSMLRDASQTLSELNKAAWEYCRDLTTV
jgi:hypothetical protein